MCVYIKSVQLPRLRPIAARYTTIGFGRSRQEVLAIVERVLSSQGIEKRVSGGWWISFVQRHSIIVLRNPASQSVARVKGSDP